MSALTILALLRALMDLPEPQLATGGIATDADEGVLEQAARNRQLAPCAECIGMVALLEPQRVGQRVWLQRVGQAPEGPFQVVDCAGHGLPFERWLVDVDYRTARRWAMKAPVFVSLWLEERYGASGPRFEG